MTGPFRERLRDVATSPVIHPILFAAYPVVFLWAQNLRDVPPIGVALLLIGGMVAGALLVFALAYLVLRHAGAAGVVTTVLVGSFTAFGRVSRELGLPFEGDDAIRLQAVWLIGTGALVWVGARLGRRSAGLTATMNVVSAALVALNVIPIVASAGGSHGVTAAWSPETAAMSATAAGPARDVYYLIFDRYAGEETLRDMYAFDNGTFLSGLEDRGFVVVDDALANYPQTTHSLASSLNLTYLDDLAERMGETSGDWGPLRASLDGSTLATTLRTLGYTYVHIGSWWTPTWEDPAADRNHVYGGFSEFAQTYWDTTMWPAIQARLGGRIAPDDRIVQWNRVHYQVDTILETARDPALTFTFAHFTLPHTPYVFQADGSLTEPGYLEPAAAYVEQLRYTNTVIDRIVDDLLAQPGPDPIIVIQSDEGPHPPNLDYAGNIPWAWPEQSNLELGRKLRILEAIHLPDLPDTSAYADITPVNVWRLILDDYFGAELARLPDRVYAHADQQHPYLFVDVTERLRPDE